MAEKTTDAAPGVEVICETCGARRIAAEGEGPAACEQAAACKEPWRVIAKPPMEQ